MCVCVCVSEDGKMTDINFEVWFHGNFYIFFIFADLVFQYS